MKIVGIAVSLLIFMLLFLKIGLKVYVNIDNQHVSYQFSIIIWKWEKSVSLKLKSKKKKKKALPKFVKTIDYRKFIFFILLSVKNIFLRLLATLELKDIYWITTLGLKDAALTGRFTGHIWTIKSLILGKISHLMRMRDMPVVEVYPCFNRMLWKMEFKCIIYLRLGHVIIAGIQMIVLFIRLFWMSRSTYRTSIEYQTIEK